MPFGIQAEIDPVEVTRANAIRTTGKLLGLFANALANHRRDDADEESDSPCPDAAAGQAETPCEKGKRDLLAKAKAKREERMRARAGEG